MSVITKNILLTGFFLVVLGLGNLLVGTYKVAQYEEVAQELEVPEFVPKDLPMSPMMRIEHERQNTKRQMDRQTKALSKLELYGIVALGGRLILGAGIFLSAYAALMCCINRLIRHRDVS